MSMSEEKRVKLEADEAELGELASLCRRYSNGREQPDDEELSHFLEHLASVLERYRDEAGQRLHGERSEGEPYHRPPPEHETSGGWLRADEAVAYIQVEDDRIMGVEKIGDVPASGRFVLVPEGVASGKGRRPVSSFGTSQVVCDDGSVWTWSESRREWRELDPVPGTRRAREKS